jgi:hypothetical protein
MSRLAAILRCNAHGSSTLNENRLSGSALDESLYALDSTTIDLCLALFPWAQFRRRKAAVKLHTLLDLRPSLFALPMVRCTMSTSSTRFCRKPGEPSM